MEQFSIGEWGGAAAGEMAFSLASSLASLWVILLSHRVILHDTIPLSFGPLNFTQPSQTKLLCLPLLPLQGRPRMWPAPSRSGCERRQSERPRRLEERERIEKFLQQVARGWRRGRWQLRVKVVRRQLKTLAATPTTRLAVETTPSLAPRTAARSQPMCCVRCFSRWNTGIWFPFLRLLLFGGHICRSVSGSQSIPPPVTSNSNTHTGGRESPSRETIDFKPNAIKARCEPLRV